jgi:hypothetical protein
LAGTRNVNPQSRWRHRPVHAPDYRGAARQMFCVRDACPGPRARLMLISALGALCFAANKGDRTAGAIAGASTRRAERDGHCHSPRPALPRLPVAAHQWSADKMAVEGQIRGIGSAAGQRRLCVILVQTLDGDSRLPRARPNSSRDLREADLFGELVIGGA